MAPKQNHEDINLQLTDEEDENGQINPDSLIVQTKDSLNKA